jgi:hypothetical protein
VGRDALDGALAERLQRGDLEALEDRVVDPVEDREVRFELALASGRQVGMRFGNRTTGTIGAGSSWGSSSTPSRSCS